MDRGYIGPYTEDEDDEEMSYSDGYGYGSGNDDSDGYDSEGSDDEENSDADPTGTPAQDDDETSSAAGSLKKFRTRSNDYHHRPTLYVNHDRQSFLSALTYRFNLPDLKSVLVSLNLPRSGKKADLATRLADHMNILLLAKNYTDLNVVIGLLNPRMKQGWSSGLFAPYSDPVLVSEFMAKSKLYQFKIEPPIGYKIEKYVTGPAYIPLAKEETAKRFHIEFNYPGPLDRLFLDAPFKEAKELAVLVLRIHEIKENPVEGSVKYRFSYGSKLEGIYVNGQQLFHPYPMEDISYPFFPLKNCLAAGTNILNILCEFKAPYYIQLVEMSQDYSAKPTIPAEKVKKAFLDRSRQSDVQASSIQLSLRCPLSLVRIKTPVRFETCKHLQCMELDAWTSYSGNAHSVYGRNTAKACPICNSVSSRLVIDGYFKEILAGTNEDNDMVTVDVENELKWSVHSASASRESISLNPEAPASLPSSPIPLVDEPILVDLYDDNTVYDSPWVQPVRVKTEPALPTQHLPTVPQARPSPSTADDGVVDLTRDSPSRPARVHGSRFPPRPFVPVAVPEFEIIEID